MAQKLKKYSDISHIKSIDKFSSWEYNEWQNYTVDINCTNNIIKELKILTGEIEPEIIK